MDDRAWMKRAIELAARGKGWVEPNPMVGCVVVVNNQVVSEGYHQRYGGPHAEVEALQSIDADQLTDATVYVTLEPCSHWGKTPPCAPMLVSKRPKRVVVAMQDPFPEVAGRGIDLLRENGIDVTLGIEEEMARELNAPYLKLIQQKRPWVIAKWAMTLDGAIATATGDSKWISGEASRTEVHRMRGELDGILVGIETVLADDPMLTARSPSPARVPRRIVLDRAARLPIQSQLVQTAHLAPVWVVCTASAPNDRVARLRENGVRVVIATEEDSTLECALDELGRERCTNVLIEGGGTLLGNAFDRSLIDQIECFIAPKIIGNGLPPVKGNGVSNVSLATKWRRTNTTLRDDDVHITLRRFILPTSTN